MRELIANNDLFPCEEAFTTAYQIAEDHWDAPRLGGRSPRAVAAGATFLGLVLASEEPTIDDGAPARDTNAEIRKPHVDHDFDVTQAEIADAFGLTEATVVHAHRVLTRIVYDSVDNPGPLLEQLKPIADRWAEEQDRRVV